MKWKIFLASFLAVCIYQLLLVGDIEMKNKKLIVIMLGPPGSGKGTQTKLLSEDLAIPQISTGDLFRFNMKENTPLGLKAKGFVNSGKLVPDDLVLEMVDDRVKQPDCKNGYLLDGVPRTVPQALALENGILKNSRIVIINLVVSNDVIIKRAEGRLLCKQCGSIYNRYFSPPKNDRICDKCGGQLYQREDDKPEVVKERLRVYNDQTKPLLEYYQKNHGLINVDGDHSSEVVFQELKSHIR